MIRRLSLVLLAVLVVACGAATATASPSPRTSAARTPRTTPSPTPSVLPSPTPTDMLAGMSLEQKVGQLIMVGFPGATLTANLQSAFQQYRFGSVVLTDGNGNGGSAATVTSLIAAIQQAEGAGPGVLVTTNQEGGTVCFRSTGMPCAPGAREQGATGSTQVVAQDTTEMARSLKQLGFQSGLAPDADVWDGVTPFIEDRSFGTDPASVSQMVTAAVQADHAQGIVAVAKHFPGHGSAGDSHEFLPTVSHSLATLQSTDLPPFEAAIKAGVDMVMVGHLLVPAIDPNLPTSLSPNAIALLRQTLGFQGVIITDDLSMQAVTQHYGESQAALMAIKAGVDIVMFSNSVDAAISAAQLIVQQVQAGTISEAQIDQSVERVLTLKQKYGLG
ncbi:MAG: glycoside hydrolase family 3 N-terminal domain-containing protein [Candidatus Dormiibacterota bacterium]